jgi:hypothetical protein
MLTEAASLLPVSHVRRYGRASSIPSIVIVAVNVQHLLALDTEHSIQLVSFAITSPCAGSSIPREHAFSQTCVRRLAFVHGSDMPLYAGSNGVLPVPRTTTSYSGAISSMVIGGGGVCKI